MREFGFVSSISSGDDLVESEGFETAGAVEAPAGVGELVDEEVLVGGGGLEFGDIAFEQAVESGRVFVTEDGRWSVSFRLQGSGGCVRAGGGRGRRVGR